MGLTDEEKKQCMYVDRNGPPVVQDYARLTLLLDAENELLHKNIALMLKLSENHHSDMRLRRIHETCKQLLQRER